MSDFAEIAAKANEGGNATPAAAAPAAAADAVGETDDGTGGEGVAGAAQEEESTAQFEPVVQLDEVEVKTHEEDEEILWKMRAKLFIYGETLLNKGKGIKEWVERGIGEVKFLQHKENKMVRVLMRQEKTMKVICNHVADPRIVLKPNAGSDRSWVWNAYDFTEGQLEETTFALRFANSDSANDFLEQFKSAQKVLKDLMVAGEAAAPDASSAQETSAPTGEEASNKGAGETAQAANPDADAAADALEKLNVGEKATTEKAEAEA